LGAAKPRADAGDCTDAESESDEPDGRHRDRNFTLLNQPEINPDLDRRLLVLLRFSRRITRMREIMTPEQVADYLQLNTDTVYRLIRGKHLAAAKIGRTYRIPKEDVETFLLSRSTRPLVREAMIKRVAEIGERNAARYPGLTSDQVLEDLEAYDEERKSKHSERRQLR
jgi:excisionase family DNA binding protein